MRELLDVEHELWRANLAGHGAFYADFLRPDALAVSPWGTLTRDEAVATINANQNPYTSYEITEPQVVPLGPDAAVLTYRAEVHGENEGEPFRHTVYATSVHVREDGRWRGAFHQQTLVSHG